MNDFETEFMCIAVEVRDVALFLSMYTDDDTVLFSEICFIV